MVGNASKKIIPDFVIGLEGDDDMLCERVMSLPQKVIQVYQTFNNSLTRCTEFKIVFQDTHWDETRMLQRLAEYRLNNNTEDTVLRFFDEAEIHPILIELIDLATLKPKTSDEIFEYVVSIIGAPIPGFGISLEEEEEIRKLEEQQRRLLEEEQRIERKVSLHFYCNKNIYNQFVLFKLY